MATAKGVKVIICTVYAYDPAHPAPWMAPTGAAPVTFYDVWRTPLNNSIGLMNGVTLVDYSPANLTTRLTAYIPMTPATLRCAIC
ncbi:MAG TPA: hypothetical protein VGK36_16460 [Candidatus Angelobacter sp.]